jgi:hypothetical protein
MTDRDILESRLQVWSAKLSLPYSHLRLLEAL